MLEQGVSSSLAGVFPSPLEKVMIRDARHLLKGLAERGWIIDGGGLCGIKGYDGKSWYVESAAANAPLLSKVSCHDKMMPMTSGAIGPDAGRIAVIQALWERLPASQKVMIHAYPHMTMKWSQKGQVFVFSHHDYATVLGASASRSDVKVTIVPKDVTPFELAMAMENWYQPDLPVLVHAGHGIYSWADDFEPAIRQIEAIEFLCQSY